MCKNIFILCESNVRNSINSRKIKIKWLALAIPNSRFNKFNLVFLFNQLVMKKKAYITPITTITPLPYMEAMLDSSESIGDESLGTPVYMMPNNPFRKPERKKHGGNTAKK